MTSITAIHISSSCRDLPLSVGAPDTIEATARSSRTDRMADFMMAFMLSGQQAECCGGSSRPILYREPLGGSAELSSSIF